jgi:dihydroflavonol-4-reductase
LDRGARLRVFITGATGFVGSHVAQELSRRGAELRILIRPTSKLENLAGLPAETVLGDLLQVDALRSAVSGCDAVMHVAADYRLWVTDPKTMHATNVTGTRELLRVAREEGVARVVYTSSVATMGFFSDGRLADEATPVSLAAMIGHYKRSKYLAEQEAINAARDGQQVIILNPTTPIGSGDIKPTPTGRIVVDFLNRRFPAYMDTGLNLVDVHEVARTGLPSPTMRVPHSVAMMFALWDQSFTGRLRGREPRATVEAVRMGKKKMFVSSAKAERELGFRVVPVYAALRSAIDWFRAHGYAPAT